MASVSGHRRVARVPTSARPAITTSCSSLKYVQTRVSRPLPANATVFICPEASTHQYRVRRSGSRPIRGSWRRAPSLRTPRRLGTVRLIPMPTPPRGRPDDSACNNPESWQIWYSFDREALDDALVDSDIVDAGIKSYAYAHNDFPDKLSDGSDHPHLYNPVDVIRGIRDNYRTASPHPNVAIRATLPDELPTLLNGGTLLYFAIRVNFSEIDTTSPPTANVPYYGIWSPIQEFRIRCGTSSTLPHGDCGWRLGL